MASKLINTILWTLASVNVIALVLGGLISWLGYAIPVRLRQFGLSPELTQMAGFAALLIACLGLCALNYSSHYALNAYGLSCALSILFLLFGMIPDHWRQSISEQQASSLQHHLDYVNYTSTLTGKGLLAPRAGGNGRNSGVLMLELIYFALLFALTVLLVFAFILGQYFRRQELEEAEQHDQVQPHHQANSHAGAGCCDSNNCTCELGPMLDASLRPGSMALANATTGRERPVQGSSGQLDCRAVDRKFIHNQPRRSLNSSSIMRRQPVSMITRDASNQPWTDAPDGVSSNRTNNYRDNISIINRLRGNLSSRSLVSLKHDETSRRSFAGCGRDSGSNDEDDDASFGTTSRQKQHRQSLERRNSQLPPLVHRGFYYKTVKDNHDPQHQRRHQEVEPTNGSADMLDVTKIDRSSQPVDYNHDMYSSNNLPADGEVASCDTIIRRHKRQQQVAGHQQVTNLRNIRCRCDLQPADGACESLHTYYYNKPEYYNTMPGKLSLSSVYAIGTAPSGQRLVAPKQKRPKPSGGSSVMAVTAAAAAALLGGVTGSGLMDDGGAVGAGGSGAIDSYFDDGMPTDVMGDSGLEMTNSLGQHTGCDVGLFGQHDANGRVALESDGHGASLMASGAGQLQAQTNQSFRGCVNSGPGSGLGALLELNNRYM